MKDIDLWISTMPAHNKASLVAIRSSQYILHLATGTTRKKSLAEAAKRLRDLAKECDALAREK
jgi:hypothetical protein